MELLKKTRKINRLVQKKDSIEYADIAELLSDIIEANTYIIANDGTVKGYALVHEYECDIMQDNVIEQNAFSEDYTDFAMSIRTTKANIPNEDENCSFIADTKCIFKDKMTTIVPIYSKGERIGTLIAAKYDNTFDDEDILLAEYVATLLSTEIMHEHEDIKAEEVRQSAAVDIAFSTLSFSELEAVKNIIGELDDDEGLLVASKIADRVGLTRSVIVNALRKFESAGVIETKSLGMKGTYIHVLNPLVFEELKKRSRKTNVKTKKLN